MGVEQPLVSAWTVRSKRRLGSRPRVLTFRTSTSSAITAVLVLASLICLAIFNIWRETSFSILAPLVLAGGLLLRGTHRLIALTVTTAVFVAATLAVSTFTSARTLSSLLGLGCTLVFILAVDRYWSRSGGVGERAASTLLTDLKQRHETQTNLPTLPDGWDLDACVLPANGESICGDVVVGREADGIFNTVLLDVSGCGSTAASRAVLLGGAVSGLLGAVEPCKVLPSTNDYVVRQGWSDGFASATHVAVDLETGHFRLGSAGHPAAIHFHAGNGRWEPLHTRPGVVLGIVEGLKSEDYALLEGQMEPGDVLVLYSDGVVEHKNVDIGQGVDRMLGTAEREITDNRPGAAARIAQTARAGESDDRTVVVLRRL